MKETDWEGTQVPKKETTKVRIQGPWKTAPVKRWRVQKKRKEKKWKRKKKKKRKT